MARDLNRLMEDLQNSRQVFVTADGDVEDGDEARENERREASGLERPKPRTVLKPERFAAPGSELVRVSATVLDAMHAEAGKHSGETGGILVGPDTQTVTRLIPSGPNAERTISSYELDVRHLQPLLAKAEGRGLQFLGVWHTHPRGYDEFSETDRASMRRMLSDPDYGVSRLVMPLTVRRAAGFTTEFFVVEGSRADIRPARLVVGSTTGAINTASRCRLEPAGPMNLLTPAASGPGRLARDLEQLREGEWQTAVHQDHEGLIVVVVQRKDVEVYLCLPPEFPFAPPDVVARADDKLTEFDRADLPETARWSSLRSLATVAEQAAKAVGERPPEAPRARRFCFSALLEPLLH